MRYKATKDVTLSGVGRNGAALEVSFEKGYYETKDEDEIALLDRLATDPDHPVGFDPKDKEA